MAQMVLGSIGQYIGNQFGYGQLGGMIGAVAGSVVDNYLFPNNTKGSRLTDLQVLASTEGAAIYRVDGTIRVSGQVIWATKFKETKKTTSGKGTGSSSTTYKYKISFAVGLCQGVVKTLGRIWADGNILDTSKYTIRFYQGSETQTADSLISETEGSGNSPAYRGLCYVVFEDMDVTSFGARIPQLQFEITRPITADNNADALENIITSVNLIPGAGEFVYATTLVIADDDGTTQIQNGANSTATTYSDALVSLDDLEGVAPNLKSVAIVVGWFGSDLRAGECVIKPKVEQHGKSTYGEYTDDDETKKTTYKWEVDGVSRSDADIVSYEDGYPAYGGTPADRSVTQIIKELKSRGWKVTFYPFVFMDIASGNTLADPYSDNAAVSGQPVFPWRGRITCSPATGYAGSVDKTSAAADQIATFFTRTWGYDRMVEHYANLCKDAGGVDAFIIASELRGLTHVRSAVTTFPAVTQLKSLAASVKSIVGSSCKVGYAADWSEWNGYQSGDAAGAFQFNLDPLWSDGNIDFIGIDNYMPLADWRDGTNHKDFVAGYTSIYDRTYLQGNIQGGEDYDWYYASDADRDSQTRTAISDPVYGKSWIWQQKNLKQWWLNQHYNRIDGTESITATAWVPQSKPFRFTELGCPAIDKGANQPNVFYDPKSSESAVPYYSTGDRDDLMQRAFLEAHYLYWADSAHNPTSSVYSGTMVATDYTASWCWDARPYPHFPGRTDLWSDADNYTLGHWLNGRLGAVLLSDLVKEICEESGFTDYDVSNLVGLVTGYAKTQTMSAYDELQQLSDVYFFDAVESQGSVVFRNRGSNTVTKINVDDLVLDRSSETNDGFHLLRTNDSDLPNTYFVKYINSGNNYEQGTYRAKRLTGQSERVVEATLPLVMDRGQAGKVGDRLIQEAWVGRETATFSLPSSYLFLDVADEIEFVVDGGVRRMQIKKITDSTVRTISATACDPTIYGNCASISGDTTKTSTTVNTGRAILAFMDIPMLQSTDVAHAPHLAAYASPWNCAAVYRSSTDSNYALDTTIADATDVGVTLYDFYCGPTGRWDNVNSLYVKLYKGTLSSADETSVLNGANALALQNGDVWEVIQFATATLIDTQQWKLTRLLRGQRGTEANMCAPLAAGARVVVLDERVVQSNLSSSQYAGTFSWKWGPADKDISNVAYQSESKALTGYGLYPFSPCHVKYAWNSSGDLTIYWVRRDRDPSADSWDQTEIPMSEAVEKYELEIKNASGAVLRTVTGLTVSSYLYPATLQAEDFGTALKQGSTLIVSVYQVSSVVGRGIPKTETFYL